MSWAVRGLLRCDCLNLPFVGTAAAVAIGSTIMAVGLNVLGHSAENNVVTSAFTVAAIGGAVVTSIGVVAYAIIQTANENNNNRVARGYY